MSIPQILEVAIAMIVIYYLLGLVVSFFTKRITEVFETRGKVLEEYIKKIVGDDKVGDFYKFPQLESLKPVRPTGFLGLGTLFSGKVNIKDRIEKIPLANLVDAFFDFCKVGSTEEGNKEYTADELKNLVNIMPEFDGREDLLSMIEKGEVGIKNLRDKVSMWLNGMLDQAATHYKAKARQIVILLSILVTVAFAVDSIDLGRQFWNNADLRMIANAKATTIVQDDPNANLDEVVSDLGDLKIEYGWGQLVAEFNEQKEGEHLPWVFWKFIGLSITAAAVSQGSSFWYDILRQLKGEAAKPKEETG